MASFYEVPVIIEVDEESMCVYIKVYADNASDAKDKAVAITSDTMYIYSEESDIVKVM